MLLRFPHMTVEPRLRHWKLALGTASFPPTLFDFAVFQYAVVQEVGDGLVVGHRLQLRATAVPLAVKPFVIVVRAF